MRLTVAACMRARCREVAKAVRLRKAATIVVAPNIEQIEAEGGLDDLLTSILTQAQAGGIPIVFALSRKKLGQVPGSAAPLAGYSCLFRRGVPPSSMRGPLQHLNTAAGAFCSAGRSLDVDKIQTPA